MRDSFLLIARVGWMHYYRGLMPGDDKLIGGGSYNVKNVGLEVQNFLPRGRKLLGFVQGKERAGQDGAPINLRRISPRAEVAESISPVTVVFVARRPGIGQVVIGWYAGARVLRELLKVPGNNDLWYNLVGGVSKSVLLPLPKRTETIRRGRGGVGQSNIWYPLHENGEPKRQPWIDRLKRYVSLYDGPNLLKSPEIDEENESADRLDQVVSAAQGQGFVASVAQRIALEQLAMSRAKSVLSVQFGRQNVRDVSKTRSYDFEVATRRGSLMVEVKGTTGGARQVILTRREDQLRRKGDVALFLVHSIKIGKRDHVTGGQHLFVSPADYAKSTAKAITLMCLLR